LPFCGINSIFLYVGLGIFNVNHLNTSVFISPLPFCTPTFKSNRPKVCNLSQNYIIYLWLSNELP
jgi:hypothetical protein